MFTENYTVIALAALIGTINITGFETGAFLSLEQAILPQTVKNANNKNTIFALYNMVGTFSMSAGILISGLPSILGLYGFNQIESIRSLFALYSLFGIGVVITYLMLTKEIETRQAVVRPITKTFSPKSKLIVGKLSGLFAIDSFAGGFVIQSIVFIMVLYQFWCRSDNPILYFFSCRGTNCLFLHSCNKAC
jgi:hypothetical protein